MPIKQKITEEQVLLPVPEVTECSTTPSINVEVSAEAETVAEEVKETITKVINSKKKKKSEMPDLFAEEQTLEVIVSSPLKGKFILVRVGNERRPASEQDIKDIEGPLNDLFERNKTGCLLFVTHHCVDVQVFG